MVCLYPVTKEYKVHQVSRETLVYFQHLGEKSLYIRICVKISVKGL